MTLVGNVIVLVDVEAVDLDTCDQTWRGTWMLLDRHSGVPEAVSRTEFGVTGYMGRRDEAYAAARAMGIGRARQLQGAPALRPKAWHGALSPLG